MLPLVVAGSCLSMSSLAFCMACKIFATWFRPGISKSREARGSYTGFENSTRLSVPT